MATDSNEETAMRPSQDDVLPRYIPYEVPLRPKLGIAGRVRLVLPSDLTETEAEHLCEFIKAVSFPDR